jgi:hypothetical protein
MLMSSDHKIGNDRESKFSFGVRELRAADMAEEFGVEVGPLRVVNENRGVDPYNTSGRFDRHRNWMRVGKR